MARIRSIKPEAFTSESMACLPIPVRWTFAGLWTHVDDEGRAVDNARLIAAALYPLDDDMPAAVVEEHLVLLAKHGKIVRYEVAGRRYLMVRSWRKHQKINKPTASRLPHPDDG